jgi:hypothetical protein
MTKRTHNFLLVSKSRTEFRFIVIFDHYISAKQYTLCGCKKIGIFTQTHSLIIMNSAKEKYECEAYGVWCTDDYDDNKRRKKKNNTISIRC